MDAPNAANVPSNASSPFQGKGLDPVPHGKGPALSPVSICILIVLLISVTEGLIMAILPFFKMTPFTEAIADIVILTAVIIPAILYFVFLPMNRNIMAIRLANERAQQEMEKVRTLGGAAPDAIIMLDSSGKVFFWNDAAERMFGYTAGEAAGADVKDLIIPERFHKAHKEGFEKFATTGRGPIVGKVTELTALRKGGQECAVELSLSPVKFGGVYNVIGIIRDITQRKMLEEKVKEQLDYLMRFQAVAVDREFRIKELKDENGRLKAMIGDTKRGQVEKT